MNSTQINDLLNTPDDKLTAEQRTTKAALISLAQNNIEQEKEAKIAELTAKGNQLLEKRKALRAEIKEFDEEDDIQVRNHSFSFTFQFLFSPSFHSRSSTT